MSLRKTISKVLQNIGGTSPSSEETLTKKEPSEFYLVKTKPKGTDTPEIYSKLEERITTKISLDKLEKLYRLDFLTFRLVNKYIENIVGPGYYLEGDIKTCKQLRKWANKVGLKRIGEQVVQSIFLGGNGWVELGYSQDGNDILKLLIKDPKYMDYIREKKHGYVDLDPETHEFIGYERKEGSGFEKVEWKKDQVLVGGDVRQRFTGKQDGRDRIAHFKLYGYEESYLGLTPLEPCYRQAIIRLNISRNAGEVAYRSEGLIITVGDENNVPSNEKVDNISESFEDIETDTLFTFKGADKVKVERLPTPELTGREALLYYFADALCTGMGVPLTLIMEPMQRGRATDIESKSIEFEYTVKALQERLADQIRDKIFYRYMDAKGIPREKLEKVIFKTNEGTIKLAKARRINTLAKYKLIRYDPELEKSLRRLEDLPMSELDKIIKKWKKTGELPKEIDDKEEDIKDRLSELEEEVEELRRKLGET